MEDSSAGDGENAATDLIPQMRPAVDERGMGGLVVLNVSCVPVDERQFRKNVVDAGEEEGETAGVSADCGKETELGWIRS